ncbi:MAG: NTP transferase domain-containing protein [Pseudomonadota bacterium]
MEVAILAGGQGRRLGVGPAAPIKALYPVAGKPLIWHVMQRFARYGYRDFCIALGHRGPELVEGIDSYSDLWCGVGPELALPQRWTVRTLHTGEQSTSGERIRQIAAYGSGPFMLAWCDGVADIDLAALEEFHRASGCLVTVAAVHPPARFGHLLLDGGYVSAFYEKHQSMAGWINGGFFVVEPEILAYLGKSPGGWEQEILPSLARDGQLAAFRHPGFWHCVDYPEDAVRLEALWRQQEPPWSQVESTEVQLP